MTVRLFKLALFGCSLFVALVGARAIQRGRIEALREEQRARLAAPRPSTARPPGFDTTHRPAGSALTTAGLPVAPPAPPVARPPRGKVISLVYGGNRQGEIEPCG